MKLMENLDRKAVQTFALALAKKYAKKDVVIGLVGELGAGKTAFTKDFTSYFGIKKTKSPTFVVGSVYPIGNRTLYHYDFYRLTDIKQLAPLGFDEILASKNRIVLIEWVDKFPHLMKKCNLLVRFEITGKQTRHVTIS